MSNLWRAFIEDDPDRFQRVLFPAGPIAQANIGSGVGSYGTSGTSPRAVTKSRRTSGYGASFGAARQGAAAGARNDINSRDHMGLTLLLRAASSTSENAIAFVRTLLDHPAIDIYVQDAESGWNALHRALYNGNISIARMLLEKERRDLTGHTVGASVSRVGQLIKTKDHEGNSPFDVYNCTIGERALRIPDDLETETSSESDEAAAEQVGPIASSGLQPPLYGEDLFTFGSNVNLSLGLGDEDNRQFPERVYLRRPDHLIQRFYRDYLAGTGVDKSSSDSPDLSEIPALVQSRPLVIQDIVLSKLHSAALTADPISNLYVCGIGRGGRLGLGDENTRFTFASVQGGLADKRVIQVALGQNHTMAITEAGELWTWGSNTFSQLGYALPPPAKRDEDPISTSPRQVFGALKKEEIQGIAASAIHSVAHAGTCLYCWGKNVGQLALMDADSRSLEVQQTPRKVAASLFSSTVVMVSAIDKATSCLLANYTVCVFTSYGYNIVKFSVSEVPRLLRLSAGNGAGSMSSRYDPDRNHIHHIASGGETIVAVNKRGDLFAMVLNHQAESNQSTASTTNPSKIRGSVTQPQRIWTARKDGVRSVGVGEHGSVIISTQSGAVWRRIKRANAKDTRAGAWSSDSKKRDFKFQRVPYITNVVAVRSSAHGAFAAVRKDSNVMREQVSVGDQTLWADVAPLLSIRDFEATEPSSQEKDNLKFWNADDLKERLGSVAYEVLKSPDLEGDLQRCLARWAFGNEPVNTVLCTSASPDLKIPVHSWILCARSSILRRGLSHLRKYGSFEMPDVFKLAIEDDQTTVTFSGLDLITLLNLVLFMYEDKVIPAWNFTRQAPALAYRYRQIRAELMKLATRLSMLRLEEAVRIQTNPKRCMHEDYKLATKDRVFFEDGDALLELDGAEVAVHTSLMCQRCPWFRGLFMGRSGGLWLASRRAGQDPSEKVRIDLKHMDAQAFKFVLQHLYADIGEELFDPVVSASLDDFTDLVMDVMSIANELMLDRLSQICQKVMGRFAHGRNISLLLNAISPCSVTEFKDAGLEYVCLQMESMLENHLLDDLDDDLLSELDEIVRDNQATQLPLSKSGRAELELHARHPELAQDVDEERQRRVREMAFRASQRDEERKLSSSFKARFGSLDEPAPVSPSPGRARRKSKAGCNEPFSPDLRPKGSQADLIFDMDEEEAAELSSPLADRQKKLDGGAGQVSTAESSAARSGPKGARISSSVESPASSPAGTSHIHPPLTPSKLSAEDVGPRLGNPWRSSTLVTSKSDLREIMTEATFTKPDLSAGPTAQRVTEAVPRQAQAKLSQKERKKQQQQQAAQATQAASPPQSGAAWETPSSEARQAPWKAPPTGPKTSLKDVLAGPAVPPPPRIAKPLVATEASAKPISRRTASPDTRFAGQSRGPSAASGPAGYRPTSKSPASASSLVPHSKSYIKPASKAEPSLGLSMSDIIGQQQREQEIVKEAVAKRSLQEIQEEQAFQEWWDQESRRTQEEEARRLAREKEKEEGKDRGGRRGRGRPRGGGAGKGGGGGGSAMDAGSSKGKGRGGVRSRATDL